MGRSEFLPLTPVPSPIEGKGRAQILSINQTDQFCFRSFSPFSLPLFLSAFTDHRPLHRIRVFLHPGDSWSIARSSRRTLPHQGSRLAIELMDSLRIQGTRRRCSKAQARRSILPRREGSTTRPRRRGINRDGLPSRLSIFQLLSHFPHY